MTLVLIVVSVVVGASLPDRIRKPIKGAVDDAIGMVTRSVK